MFNNDLVMGTDSTALHDSSICNTFVVFLLTLLTYYDKCQILVSVQAHKRLFLDYLGQRHVTGVKEIIDSSIRPRSSR